MWIALTVGDGEGQCRDPKANAYYIMLLSSQLDTLVTQSRHVLVALAVELLPGVD